jgi:iron complex transport system substrate-binding protein
MKLFVLNFICASLFILGCKNGQNTEIETITVTDMLNRKVKVPKNVSKIVGLKAGALRMISYLNASDMVVGIEENEKQNKNPYNFANPEYVNLPVIGPQHGGDPELIALSQPDIIFVTYTTASDANKLQNQTNIPVVALDYGDLIQNRETFYTGLKLIAKLIHKSPRADSLINFIENTIEDLNRRTYEISLDYNPKVYAGGVSFRGSHGISSTAAEFAPFDYINANNLASTFKSANNSVFIDKEQLIEWNPKKIFIDYAGWEIVKDELKQNALSQMLDAVKNNDLYLLLPYNWYTTNFATTLVNSYYTGSIIFPNAFSDITFEEKADNIYKAFLNKPVYNEMIKQYGEPKQVFLRN